METSVYKCTAPDCDTPTVYEAGGWRSCTYHLDFLVEWIAVERKTDVVEVRIIRLSKNAS